MRLTLRTLLAFMDDILEPQDQEDLARQIEESEKGTELIHRTRDAMRRLRLGAPPVIGQGMELDPNFPSEYLDSTLSSDQMTDYQQVCLDSDVHLAEVASCHHILTMVLGEPAEIDPEMRRKMYAIPQRQAEQLTRRIDAPHAPVAATSPAAQGAEADATPAPVPVVSRGEEPMTEVPDYLRAGSRTRANRLLVAAVALLALGALAYFSFGPQGWFTGQQGQQVATGVPPATTGDDQATVAPPEGTAPEGTASEGIAPEGIGPAPDFASPNDVPSPGEGGPPVDREPFEPVPSIPAAPAETTTTPPDGSDLPDLGFDSPAPPVASAEPGTVDPAMETPAASGPEVGAQPAPGTIDAPPLVAETPPGQAAGDPLDSPRSADQPLPDEPGAAVATPDATVPPGTGLSPVEPAAPTPSADAPLAPPAGAPLDEVPVVGPIPPQVPATPAASATDSPAPAAAGPLGTLTSPTDILLRYNPETDQWLRMKVNTPVHDGDQLKSLPTYRPSIALTSGLRLELADGTMVELSREVGSQWMTLDLTYGRLMLVNTGMDPSAIVLRVAGVSRLVEIAPARIVALDIVRPFVPGQLVHEQPSPVEGMVYVPQGGAVWTVDGTPRVIEGPAQWDWNVGPAGQQPFDERVAWLGGQQLDLLDRNASWRMEQQFDTERPAGEQLLVAYEQSRRREEKVLLAKSAIHVGQFVPFVNALADSNQHSNWDSHITDLRAAMARSPQLAERIHQTLREQRGTVPGMGDDLFEMLRGYSREDLGSTPEEIRAGVLRKLIGWLNHDRLEYRVLAFHNLRELTGKSLLYSPAEANAERRARNIRRWEQMLNDNELVPVEAAP